MQLIYYKKQFIKRWTKGALNTHILFGWIQKASSFFFAGLITVYQWTLSPDHGLVSFFSLGQCKFRPTCSEYTKKSIQKHGVVCGLKDGWSQIRRCH